MSDLPERICIWDKDKDDPNSHRGWTVSFPENHPHIYVRADMGTRHVPTSAASDFAIVRAEDTCDGLLIHPDDMAKYNLEYDFQYPSTPVGDGKYRIELPRPVRRSTSEAPELVTVGYQYFREANKQWMLTDFPRDHEKEGRKDYPRTRHP